RNSAQRCVAPMTVLGIGISYGLATLFAMFSGMPIAFALGAVAIVFMGIYMPAASLDTVTQNVYEEMASITLLSIPLFILKGAAIGKSRAGQDLYSALHAWLHRVPGGLGVANVFACALFAAMAGSSPATCSAIGSAGIPEMRKRGYSGGFAAGIIAAGGTLGILLPPSITMILYAVAAEQSLGRLFLAAIGPAFLLVALFSIYAMWKFRREFSAAQALYERTGQQSELLREDTLTVRDKFALLPRVLPFIILLTIVMEMGLIHPPVGLNIFVIKNIAPDIPLADVIWGVMPFVVLMMVAVVILCFFPGIATWFSDLVMGAAQHR